MTQIPRPGEISSPLAPSADGRTPEITSHIHLAPTEGFSHALLPPDSAPIRTDDVSRTISFPAQNIQNGTCVEIAAYVYPDNAAKAQSRTASNFTAANIKADTDDGLLCPPARITFTRPGAPHSSSIILAELLANADRTPVVNVRDMAHKLPFQILVSDEGILQEGRYPNTLATAVQLNPDGAIIADIRLSPDEKGNLRPELSAPDEGIILPGCIDIGRVALGPLGLRNNVPDLTQTGISIAPPSPDRRHSLFAGMSVVTSGGIFVTSKEDLDLGLAEVKTGEPNNETGSNIINMPGRRIN